MAWSFRTPAKLCTSRQSVIGLRKHTSYIRHKHEQLLVCITLELWISLQPLLPCFFDNLRACIGLTLVESSYVVKVDLLPYQGLESWFCLVTVVVTMIMTVAFVVVTRMIVPLMVRHVWSWWRCWLHFLEKEVRKRGYIHLASAALIGQLLLSIVYYTIIVCRHGDPLVLRLKATHQTRSFSMSRNFIIRGQRAIKQPALLDLCDISNKGLAPSLEDLVEDDPIRLPILLVFSKIFKNLRAKVDLQT